MQRRALTVNDYWWTLVCMQSAREGVGKQELVRKALREYLDARNARDLLPERSPPG